MDTIIVLHKMIVFIIKQLRHSTQPHCCKLATNYCKQFGAN